MQHSLDKSLSNQAAFVGQHDKSAWPTWTSCEFCVGNFPIMWITMDFARKCVNLNMYTNEPGWLISLA